MASLAKIINRSLNIKDDEQLAVYLLLLQTVFLGVFLSIFDITSTAMFMDTFGEEMLSKAFLISGLVGFAMTALYSKLQSVMRFSRLIVLNLFVISLITLLLRAGFEFSDNKYLVFLVFVMMGPLNLLGVVGFWGMASRLFTLRQGKRLFSLIDSGQIIGMIVISAMVPVLLSWLDDQKNLLFISSGSVICALLIQVVIINKFDLNKTQAVKGKTSEKSGNLFSLFKNKYVRAMTFFVILSMLAAFFMFYSFLPITKAKYSGDGEYLTFLGMFNAALLTFTLLFKTFAYSKLTKVYGLKLNLILPSAILGICILLAIVVGLFFGSTVESASFMLFFLMISLGRLLSVSLKSGIEVPSLKILYQSLDVSIRHRVQVAIDGMVNETAAILSGLTLMILGLFEFFQPVHYLFFLIAITVLWVFVGVRLYREYRSSLEVTLDKSRATDHLNESDDRLILKDQLTSNLSGSAETGKAQVMLDFAKELAPLNYHEYCQTALMSGNENLSRLVLTRISSEQHFALAGALQQYINNEKNETLKKDAGDLLKRFKEKTEPATLKSLIAELVGSVYPGDKVMAANILAHSANEQLSKYLIVLLRDIFPEVRIAAIKAASVIRDKEFIPAIVDYLGTEQFHYYAYEAILAYGNDSLVYVDQYFYKSGLNHKVQLQIVKLFGEIGGKQSIKYLLNKLNYYNNEIVIEACRSLKKCGYFAATPEEKVPLNILLAENIRISAWNLNVLINMREKEALTSLIKTMEQEIHQNSENIFLILSIAYNPQSVMHVKDNLELETAEGTSYALELLDMFIDESIKPLLLIIFEDISDIERVRRFQDHFPLDRMDTIDLLLALINRDVNLIGRWVKALALNSLFELDNIPVTKDIVAQLFNNDKLLSELAAKVINKNDPGFYQECLDRLDIQKRNGLVKILKSKNSGNLLYHNVVFLKNLSLFEFTDDNILLELTEEAKEFRMNPGDKQKLNGFCKTNDILIVRTGSLTIKNKGALQGETLRAGSFIPLSKLSELDNTVESTDVSVLVIIPFQTVCKFITYYPQISDLLSKIV